MVRGAMEAAAPAGRLFSLTRWHTLLAALWCSLGCGYAYTFGTFSAALKAQYHLSQGDVDTVGIATTLIGLITFTTGIYTDRVGAMAAIMTGALINIFGWAIFAFVVTQNVHLMQNPTWVFFGFISIATFGAAMCTGAIFKVITNNFEGSSRGVAVGIAKAWVGVTSGFASTIYKGIWPTPADSPERLNYLWYLAGSIVIFVLLPSPLMRIVSRSAEDRLCFPKKLRFPYLEVVTVALIVMMVFVALVPATKEVTFAFTLVLLSLSLLPWLMVLPGGSPAANASFAAVGDEHPPAEVALPIPESPWAGGPLKMLSHIEAWLLFVNVFAIQAGSLLLTVNMGEITASRGGVSVDSAAVVTVFSACNAVGRLTAGVITDWLLTKRVARPWYFAVLSVWQGVAMALLCLPGPGPLFAGVALSGYAFGSVFPMMIITVAELFGKERIASNYMIYDGMPGAMGSLLIAKLLAQTVYDANSAGDTCQGDKCFTLTYVVVLCIQGLSFVAACLLAIRSKRVYSVTLWADAEQKEKLAA